MKHRAEWKLWWHSSTTAVSVARFLLQSDSCSAVGLAAVIGLIERLWKHRNSTNIPPNHAMFEFIWHRSISFPPSTPNSGPHNTVHYCNALKQCHLHFFAWPLHELVAVWDVHGQPTSEWRGFNLTLSWCWQLLSWLSHIWGWLKHGKNR